MTLRRVLRLPADTISCAFVGEREKERERQLQKERGRRRRAETKDPLEAKERERESTGASSSVLFPLSSFSSRSLLSKKTTRQRASDRCFFFISLVLVSLSTCSLSLSQRRAWSSTELLVSALRAQQHTRSQCRPRQPWGRRAATATAESTQRRRRPLQRLLAPAPPPPKTPENRAGVRRAPGGRRRSARSTWC